MTFSQGIFLAETAPQLKEKCDEQGGGEIDLTHAAKSGHPFSDSLIQNDLTSVPRVG
jgi:hypothetical protein